MLSDIGYEAVRRVKRNFHLMTDVTEEFKTLKRAKVRHPIVAFQKSATHFTFQQRGKRKLPKKKTAETTARIRSLCDSSHVALKV